MKANISSVSSFDTGGCLVSKNLMISISSGRYPAAALGLLCETSFARNTSALGIKVSTGAAYTTQALSGSPTVLVSGSNATLRITGNYLIGNQGAPTITVNGGNGTTTGQGTLSLQDSQVNTLNINIR